MAVASLILGIIGTVAGVGALAWQVVTWNRSGPVVSVTANQGFPTYGDQLGDLITIVTANNSGNDKADVTPTQYTAWLGVRFTGDQSRRSGVHHAKPRPTRAGTSCGTKRRVSSS